MGFEDRPNGAVGQQGQQGQPGVAGAPGAPAGAAPAPQQPGSSVAAAPAPASGGRPAGARKGPSAGFINLVATIIVGIMAYAAFSLSTSFIVSVVLLIIGVVLAYGVRNLMISASMPDPLPQLDAAALLASDKTLQEAAEALNRVTADMSDAFAADKPRGIQAQAEPLSRLTGSISQLLGLKEFVDGGAGDDKRLLFSLTTSWLPDAWAELKANAGYLSFGGTASQKAFQNIQGVAAQCTTVEQALDRMRASIVDESSEGIETAAEFLKSRTGDGPRSLLEEALGPTGASAQASGESKPSKPGQPLQPPDLN